jgi:hypothetical protein
MRFTSIVAGGIVLTAGVHAVTIDGKSKFKSSSSLRSTYFISVVHPQLIPETANAVQFTDESIVVTTAKCMDGYFDCITSCPFIIPDCSTWGLNCAIIYC